MNTRRILFAVFLIPLLVLPACGGEETLFVSPTPSPQPSPSPTFTPTPPMVWPVLVDTDMALDDWMALLILLKDPNLMIVGITISGTGEAHCAQGIKNAASLVALVGHDPIPIACGRETPLQGDHVFPESWRTAMDKMLGLTVPNGSNPIQPGLDAPALILQNAKTNGLSVLALGPLTNLAEAAQNDPDTFRHIYRIFIMGGAVDVPGNLSGGIPDTDNQVAEWNIYIDPTAANIVFHSGVNITLIPLDATNDAPLTLDFYQRLQESRDTPEADFVYQALSQVYDMVQSGTYYFWDPLAAAVLARFDLVQIETRHLCVEEAEGATSGGLIESDSCPELQVAISANAPAFEDFFLGQLRMKKVSAQDTDPLTGTWQGAAQNGNQRFSITITIQGACSAGEICAHFDITDFSCSGDYRLEQIDGSRYRFSGENLSQSCTPGSEEWLELLPDGTLRYTSSHPSYGQSQGILSK